MTWISCFTFFSSLFFFFFQTKHTLFLAREISFYIKFIAYQPHRTHSWEKERMLCNLFVRKMRKKRRGRTTIIAIVSCHSTLNAHFTGAMTTAITAATMHITIRAEKCNKRQKISERRKGKMCLRISIEIALYFNA